MANINILGQNFDSWGAANSWFFGLPVLVQVAVIIFIVAVVILALIAVYYILKGVAYLLYYTFKGIGILIYRIVSGIYYAMTGKSRPEKEDKKARKTIEVPAKNYIPKKQYLKEYRPEIVYYCSECGMKFTDKMMYQIESSGVAFCEQCGKGFRLTSEVISEAPI